ncbi:hypothetical protein ACWGI1_20095, partial [Streptomyces sp. NPDC054835]
EQPVRGGERRRPGAGLVAVPARTGHDRPVRGRGTPHSGDRPDASSGGAATDGLTDRFDADMVSWMFRSEPR